MQLWIREWILNKLRVVAGGKTVTLNRICVLAKFHLRYLNILCILCMYICTCRTLFRYPALSAIRERGLTCDIPPFCMKLVISYRKCIFLWYQWMSCGLLHPCTLGALQIRLSSTIQHFAHFPGYWILSTPFCLLEQISFNTNLKLLQCVESRADNISRLCIWNRKIQYLCRIFALYTVENETTLFYIQCRKLSKFYYTFSTMYADGPWSSYIPQSWPVDFRSHLLARHCFACKGSFVHQRILPNGSDSWPSFTLGTNSETSWSPRRKMY